jgi:hypothetical protein
MDCLTGLHHQDVLKGFEFVIPDDLAMYTDQNINRQSALGAFFACSERMVC